MPGPTSARYARGFAAAVLATATLILAANAGPARAAEEGPRAPRPPASASAPAAPLSLFSPASY
ncbi:hypothetical protein ABZY09_08470 [Streptomyces sp. NPDC002928]|uniref:hypothetical protein n=1 Tax=Streptomyces sp. NPDC002928 TaxID=3154440 RepID=UPI0033AD523F